jgi:hypothetical protein
MHRHFLYGLITFAVLMGSLGSMCTPAYAQSTEERIEAMEKRIRDLEAQNQELKATLDGVCRQVEEESAAVDQLDTKVEQLDPSMFLTREDAAQFGGPTCPVTIGGDIRWRGVTFDNVWTFNDHADYDSWSFNRFRTRLSIDARPIEDVRAYIRLTNEYRWGTEDKAFSNAKHDWNDTKDIAIDNAFIEMSDIMDRPLTAKVGRQDLVFGEGFVVLDGTPYDGSETIAFDAIRLTYNLADPETAVNLIWAKTSEGTVPNPDYADADDEDLYGVYLVGKWAEGITFEPYFLVRNLNNARNWVTITPAGPAFDQLEPKLITYMPGMRVSGKNGNIGYAAELAYQFGDLEDYIGGTEDADRDAWGGYVKGTYTFADAAWTPALTVGVTYLSGDDPETEDFEGWDSFYAEWPKWSELYVYTLWDPMPQFAGVDPDLGTFTNMWIPEVLFSVKPTEKMKLTARYLYYHADEEQMDGQEKDRGHNPQILAEYQFNKYLSGHLLGEYFAVGDYHGEDADDAFFARAELMFRF